MSEKLYWAKNEARSNVESALVEYKKAAEEFGCDTDDMRKEIDDALFDAGLSDIKIEGVEPI